MKTLDAPYFFVFDVESVGLHGEGYAVGYVVIDREGKEIDSKCYTCWPVDATGDLDGRAWVESNAMPSMWPDDHQIEPSPRVVRELFWQDLQMWRDKGAVVAADVPWPVEANFLSACIREDAASRAFDGPYPLIDVASVRFAAYLDPLATEPRRENELPLHDPLADARQSARLLIEALNSIALPV